MTQCYAKILLTFYSWQMGVSPNNTFDAFNLKAGTQYKFRVTPRNRYGWGECVVTTEPVAVGHKVELPEFTRILPGQLKALQGSSIRLECQVTLVQVFPCMYLSLFPVCIHINNERTP
jgi:hypothetical protein